MDELSMVVTGLAVTLADIGRKEPVTVIFSRFSGTSFFSTGAAASGAAAAGAAAGWATARGATLELVNTSKASRFLAERAFIVRSEVAVVCGKTMARAMAYSVAAFGA
jgi:hypothetical protein